MEQVRFKTSFAENIFRNKYAQGTNDTWDALAERLVEDVCGSRWGTDRPLMSELERHELTGYIKTMRFLPGGRYLYYAGRTAKFYNNCFDANTEVVTDKGLRKVSDIGEANVLSPVDGRYYPAKFLYHGKQKVQKITFAPLRGNSNIKWDIRATRNHHWFLAGGTDTYDIRVGDVVPANTKRNLNTLGWIHGLIFGDGCFQRQNKDGVLIHQIRLCGQKNLSYLDKLISYIEENELKYTVSYPPSANGDAYVCIWSNIRMKDLPQVGDADYIGSFLLGWIQADGSEIAGKKLCSINSEAIDFFIKNAALAGITITGEKRSQIRDTQFKKNSTLYIINFNYGEFWEGYKVIDIIEEGIEDVYCPYEPIYNRIVLGNNIDTFQCYLLRAEEDTREEWANVVWRSMMCLTVGGGIGIDYSRIRPSGAAIKRTGGKASGPIPLMAAVNEIGRNVMQGGSRRSAIYASLNWQHEDIPLFLNAKNWDVDTKALKTKNFNYPAPLDMTNISVNYDDAWLNIGNKHLHPLFLKNVEQAMATGEPGFSFNFGDKQNETLRNACTEVTSEDDSDVCNLGSINIGNISNLDEFRNVVTLASKFLVCGTLRADLPYSKVREVRERNRRLGLGIMGIHEWLLKRGYKYEVTDELKKWLAVYRDESKRSADEHCDRLYISHPIAYRAIAPTGSIGILASTTTGIEPLFAVAYKRRYLTDGTRWKYEYVVDATADHLIRECGISPDKIETALDLSGDYERRIKFQADVQDYVDMSISSTINLPSWGSKGNSEADVTTFAKTLSKYAPRLRGFTAYPDGARGGQPLTRMDYNEALKHKGVVYEEMDICELTGGGTCGS